MHLASCHPGGSVSTSVVQEHANVIIPPRPLHQRRLLGASSFPFQSVQRHRQTAGLLILKNAGQQQLMLIPTARLEEVAAPAYLAGLIR